MARISLLGVVGVFFLALLIGLSGPASAISKKFFVEADFKDGSSVSGTFVYDFNTNLFANPNFQYRNGTLFAPFNDVALTRIPFQDFFGTLFVVPDGFSDFTGLPVLSLETGLHRVFDPAGFKSGPVGQRMSRCTSADCNFQFSPVDGRPFGLAEITAVPLPATAPLALAGALVLGGLGRRRRRR